MFHFTDILGQLTLALIMFLCQLAVMLIHLLNFALIALDKLLLHPNDRLLFLVLFDQGCIVCLLMTCVKLASWRWVFQFVLTQVVVFCATLIIFSIFHIDVLIILSCRVVIFDLGTEHAHDLHTLWNLGANWCEWLLDLLWVLFLNF